MIKIAKEAAIKAGEVTLSLRGKRLTIKSKERLGDFTTEADLSSEKTILRVLKTSFPRHNFRSEEIGKIDNGSEYWWVIDPLDGTIPYSSGLPTFGISIGLLKDGEPVLGVINLPVLDSLFWAEKGKGAYLNGRKIKVSSQEDLLKSVVGFDFGHIGDRQEELEKLVSPLIDKVRYPPILACTVAGLAYVASGLYDAYVHWAYPWDFVAGAAIIEEAGGKITDYKGEPINWLKDDMSVLASNGHLHTKIVSLIDG